MRVSSPDNAEPSVDRSPCCLGLPAARVTATLAYVNLADPPPQATHFGDITRMADAVGSRCGMWHMAAYTVSIAVGNAPISSSLTAAA